MKYPFIKPLLLAGIMFLVVGLACGLPTTATEEPEAVPPEKVDTEAPAPPPTAQPAEAVEPVTSSGAAATLQDAQGAVIQIEAQGSFVDPEIGEYIGAGRGSGFIIDPSGIAVTNNHVVTGAALLKVWVGGDTTKTYNAKVLGVSECSDLALIDIDGEGFSYMDWYADPVAVGLDVYVAGFPLGEPEYTLTKGIISKERASGETDWASIDSVIMHDATVNPGNSGGPLLTTDGKVVGINYRSRSAQDQYFAIGKEIALPIVEKLKGGQDVDTIGVNGVAVRSEDGSISGIWVSSVSSGSPADKTGLDGGDIVLNLEGQPLATDGTMADYCDIIRTHNPEDTLSMEVLRFATYEVLEGQLNGDALTQSYSFGDTAGTDTGGSEATGDASTDGYVVVYDDTGAIGVEVPASWNQVNGAIWEADWNNWHFKAANVIASTDIDGFFDYWNVAGVNFAASKDWGNIGGYVQLLDAAGDTWYVDSCDKEGRYDYDDGYYEGAYDLWECGSEAVVAVISARPINDPLAFLTMVQVQMVTDADVEAFEYILDTFDVVGRLP